MELPVRNLSDLRGEISRLKELELEQSIALKARFKNPLVIFSTIKSLFSKPGDAGGTKSNFLEQDLLSLISRFVLPFTLNKTLFRHSNFIIKTIVGLASQKASRFITEDSITGIWDKVSSFVKSKFKHEPSADDKRIYPVSETVS
ncbi:MAG: hypothetical protein JWP44_2023 [Mucilaginibacter sp.]|nr:hypothetical protein [Mucilaginibacter sp.]